MKEQPEALRLAGRLDLWGDQGDLLEAAAELHRLHAENEAIHQAITDPENQPSQFGTVTFAMYEALEAQRDALRAELKEATEAINDPAVNNLRTLAESIRMLSNQRDALLEALQALYDEQQGPPLIRHQAAWEAAMQKARAALAQQAEPGEPVAWYYERDTDKGLSFAPDRDPYKCWQPLTLPRPQRKPLTDEEIERLWYPSTVIAEPGKRRVAFGRAIERAHGITDPQVADRLARHGIPMPEGDPK